MEKRIDKVSKLIHATPASIYEAFTRQKALQTWLPPKGMEGQIKDFNFRQNGGYQMRLTYTGEEHIVGKTTENTDEIAVRFIRLLPNERIEQVITFSSEQSEFKGEMKMTWTLEERADATLVTVSCMNVPNGIRPEDHEMGLNLSLENLAQFVEKQS